MVQVRGAEQRPAETPEDGGGGGGGLQSERPPAAAERIRSLAPWPGGAAHGLGMVFYSRSLLAFEHHAVVKTMHELHRHSRLVVLLQVLSASSASDPGE